MRYLTRRTAVVAAAALLLGSVGACDFIQSPTGDPNAVPVAQLDQLFTTVQVNAFFMTESELGRMPSIWLQQMKGAQRQFSGYETYDFQEDVGDDMWQNVYRHGGLNDLKEAEAAAEAADRPAYAGILKIYEAYLIGSAADVWGDVPYSQAADPEVADPELDDQMTVYQQVESLLDEAIGNLGGGGAPGSVDMVFGGNTAKWIAVAHTLKARYYMHTAEVNGDAAYQAALSEAQQGITDPSGNWHAVHSTTASEWNDWYQFTAQDRSGYMEPNDFMVTLLRDRNDPRLDLYFAEFNADKSHSDNLRGTVTGTSGPGAQNFPQPIVTCSEAQFIIAEAQFKLGNTAAAQSAYEDGLACQEAYWGVTLTPNEPVTLQEIMTAKYIALFLNPEIWNDYKRTCYPQVVPPSGALELAGHLQVPPGFYYPTSERQANPMLPDNTEAVLRNTNDPNFCTYTGVN